MADTANEQGGTHWLRLIVLVALAIGAIAAGRRWAMSKADAEFEQRLRIADERRD
jgi:hypothetical protein